MIYIKNLFVQCLYKQVIYLGTLLLRNVCVLLAFSSTERGEEVTQTSYLSVFRGQNICYLMFESRLALLLF